jgi:hypothetical protein
VNTHLVEVDELLGWNVFHGIAERDHLLLDVGPEAFLRLAGFF